MTYFIDTSVIIYASGKEHPYKESCAAILFGIEQGRITGVISVEIVQELAHRFIRVGRKEEGLQVIRTISETMLPESITSEDASRAVNLLGVHDIDSRDAFHAAWMLRRGITGIISADKHFDRINGIERIDPIEFIESRF